MPLWTLAIATVASAKIALAFVACFLAPPAEPAAAVHVVPVWITGVIGAGYTAVGVALIVGGRADIRARTLGTFLLLVASAFSDPLSVGGHPLGGWSVAGASLRLDAFLPYVLWLFAGEFPVSAPAGRLRTLTTYGARLALIAGLALITANAARDLGVVRPTGPGMPFLQQLSRRTPDSFYWPLLFAMMLPVAPVLAARARRVTPAERRRVAAFVGATLSGLLPITIDVVLRATSRQWNAWMEQPLAGWLVRVLVVGALVSVPFTTAYSVVVDRVVDVRLLVRSALRYAFARYSVLALVCVPFLWLGWLVYSNRQATVQELLLGRPAVVLVVVVVAGLAALRLRRRVLDGIDRRFFREEYDAQQILTGLAEAARHADSTTRLVTLLAAEVDRALHVDHVAVLVRDATGDHLTPRDVTPEQPGAAAAAGAMTPAGAIPILSVSSLLVQLLSGSGEPLDVDLDSPRSPLGRLGANEQQWLTHTAFRLLVPLHGADGEVVGILGLGEKRSGLPYTAQDRRLLAAVGASGGIHLDRRLARETPLPAREAGPAAWSEDEADGARECFACGLVYDRGPANCQCGAPLVEALVPRLLAGKFRVDRRIGAGGMGVVYRAEDVTLGRSVALKTLSGVSVSRVSRLRREARAMALMTHPNLELIYGLEAWHGRPVLVVEYLIGGTLRDRLTNGPMPALEVVTLGVTLADTLVALHARGLLHRDIKPGNIGYSEGGTVKLLDFGIVKLLGIDTEAVTGSSLLVDEASDGRRPAADPRHSLSAPFAGTPVYMAPEALRNERAGPSFDLWGLSVVMFEALTGVNPFRGATAREIAARILSGSPPDPRSHGVACAPELAAFFTTALAVDRSARPADSREFAARLAGVLQAVGSS